MNASVRRDTPSALCLRRERASAGGGCARWQRLATAALRGRAPQDELGVLRHKGPHGQHAEGGGGGEAQGPRRLRKDTAPRRGMLAPRWYAARRARPARCNTHLKRRAEAGGCAERVVHAGRRRRRHRRPMPLRKSPHRRGGARHATPARVGHPSCRVPSGARAACEARGEGSAVGRGLRAPRSAQSRARRAPSPARRAAAARRRCRAAAHRGRRPCARHIAAS